MEVTILPGQAARISREASKTGAAIGVSQSGNSLIIDTGRAVYTINAAGGDITPISEGDTC
jgi:hypothetical protein